MASRGYAQIFTRIWSDDDFRTLSAAAQRHYFLLLSQPDINYAGVLPLTERRWARCCEETSRADVETSTAELDERRYVVVDVDTEELLVRSFVRNDELWKQPRMLTAALREALMTTSPLLRRALAEELKRVREAILRPSAGPAGTPAEGLKVKESTKSADGRVAEIDAAVEKLVGGPEDTPREALGRGIDKASAGLRVRAGAAPAPSTSTYTGTRGGAAENVSPDRARKDPACDCVPAIAPARDEPPMTSIPQPSPGRAVTGPSAADAYRLVDAAIGREHPHTVRTALAIEVGVLLVTDTDHELVFAALRLWLEKPHLGPRSLPSLVSEAIRMRNRPALKTRASASDTALAEVDAAFAAYENQTITPVLRALPGGA